MDKHTIANPSNRHFDLWVNLNALDQALDEIGDVVIKNVEKEAGIDPGLLRVLVGNLMNYMEKIESEK